MTLVMMLMNAIFNNEVWQHLKDVNNQVSQYFPNEQCMVKSHAQLKNPFKICDRPIDFNVTV